MILISEHFNEETNRQASVYKYGDRYIVQMDKEWSNQYTAEYDYINDAEDAAEDWINE